MFIQKSCPTEIYVLITGSEEQVLAPRVFLLSSSHAGSLVVHPSGPCRISHSLGETSQGSQQNRETIPIRFPFYIIHKEQSFLFYFIFWRSHQDMEIHYMLSGVKSLPTSVTQPRTRNSHVTPRSIICSPKQTLVPLVI